MKHVLTTAAVAALLTLSAGTTMARTGHPRAHAPTPSEVSAEREQLAGQMTALCNKIGEHQAENDKIDRDIKIILYSPFADPVQRSWALTASHWVRISSEWLQVQKVDCEMRVLDMKMSATTPH